MKNKRSLVFGALLAMSGVANAHSIVWKPQSATASKGNTFTLDLQGKNFFDLTDKGSISFTFDPTVVQVAGITRDDKTWETTTPPPSIDNTAGKVTGLSVQSATGHGPTFDIAAVLFKAVGSGNTDLTLSEDPNNPFVVAGTATTIPGFGTENGSVAVTAAPVPLPGAFWLLGSALATMLLGRRKSHDYAHA